MWVSKKTKLNWMDGWNDDENHSYNKQSRMALVQLQFRYTRVSVLTRVHVYTRHILKITYCILMNSKAVVCGRHAQVLFVSNVTTECWQQYWQCPLLKIHVYQLLLMLSNKYQSAPVNLTNMMQIEKMNKRLSDWNDQGINGDRCVWSDYIEN